MAREDRAAWLDPETLGDLFTLTSRHQTVEPSSPIIASECAYIARTFDKHDWVIVLGRHPGECVLATNRGSPLTLGTKQDRRVHGLGLSAATAMSGTGGAVVDSAAGLFPEVGEVDDGIADFSIFAVRLSNRAYDPRPSGFVSHLHFVMTLDTRHPPSVEVLIPAYNSRDLLRDCLRSIDRHRPEPTTAELRVAVLDDASPDRLGDMVEAEFPWVRLIREAENLGNTRSNNRLAETSTADYLLLLNHDTEWQGDVVGPLLRTLRGAAGAAGVAAGLVWPDGSPQPSTTALPSLRYELARVVRGGRWTQFIPGIRNPDEIVRRMMHVAVEYPPVQEVPFAWSTCFLLSRRMVAAEGLYDDRFDAYDSDLDWCTRMRARGRVILFDPGVKVIHVGGASRTPVERRRRELEARRLYYAIHRGRAYAWLYGLVLRLERSLMGYRLRRTGSPR